jgi:hypothetical protein
MNYSIDTIQELIKNDRVQWRRHVLVRMQQREIRIKEVLDCINNGEIIEYYKYDYPFPSCLILGFADNNRGLHVVCSVGQGYVWMITAYYPDKDQWHRDFKTRRKQI